MTLGEVPVSNEIARGVPPDQADPSSQDLVVRYDEDNGFAIQLEGKVPKGGNSKANRHLNPSVGSQTASSATPIPEVPVALQQDACIPPNQYELPFADTIDFFPEVQHPPQSQMLSAMNVDPFSVWSTMPWGAA